jgi:hypothetical protein
VLEQEIVDALTFAALIYFDPSDGFFAQTTHFEYTPRLACAPSSNGMFISPSNLRQAIKPPTKQPRPVNLTHRRQAVMVIDLRALSTKAE